MTFDEWYAECGEDVLSEYSPRELGAMLDYEINEILNDAYRDYCEQEQDYLDMVRDYNAGLGV